jgi:hypothetical protein
LSEDTYEAVAKAIREHVSSEADGAYMTDWVLIAAAAVPGDPDATMYISEYSGAPVHHRLGLIRYLALKNDEMMRDDDD